ncbi:agouti-signaling protein-like [Notolabrus celidotus]|uniref:agouti-signaling protein-like n=1 Tax=Notolabrus celidotus TaxID=1203425 RepID=UPI00148F9426|nr:agouti-signaling protein-like [Notolabrus celidotus]
MQLSVLLFGLLQLSFVSGGPSVRSDVQPAGSGVSRNNSSSSSGGSGRAQVPQSTGSVNTGRKRPLFARRGQYERQRVQKPKRVPQNVPPPPPPPDAGVKPTKPKCSQLTQSCTPQSGCCETGASCHCRFFNAICFCRRSNSLPKKNKT